MPDNHAMLKVGIAGAGLMGFWHAKYAARLGARVVAILDHDEARARELSSRVGGGPDIYTSFEDMMSGVQPDIVHICTPPESHYAIAMPAIEAGIHLIVEKPLAGSVDETETLLQAAERRGVRLCPVHQFAFQDGVQAAVNELDGLGELLKLRFTTSSAGGEGREKSDLDEIVADIIPHPLSILQKLRPAISLDAGSWSGVRAGVGELQVIGLADGVAVDISISMNARPTRCEVELFCSKGRIYINLFHGYSIVEKGGVSRRQKLFQPFRLAVKEFFVAGMNIGKRALSRQPAYPGLARLIEEFYEAVRSGTESPVSAVDTRAVAVSREEIIRRIRLLKDGHADSQKRAVPGASG